MSDHDIDRLVASVLGIAPEKVRDELAFAECAEWDSLNHVNLMVALEQALGAQIGEELMVELTSVRAIRQFAHEHGGRTA